MKSILHYFRAIKMGKVILWCYLIWYLVTVYFHYDSNLKIWFNSIGISFVIGFGLLLSVSTNSLKETLTTNIWQSARLFIMPFCVSSFSALIKGQSFILIFSSNAHELLFASSSCGLFVLCVLLIKQLFKFKILKTV